MKQRVYVRLDGTQTISTSLPCDRTTKSADLRFPSRYKKLTSYTLSWRNRLQLEATASPCMFVTFTYDQEHYFEPVADIPTTLKNEWKAFRHRFEYYQKRDHLGDFKYYVISERGDDGRLHFHALLYGFPFTTFKAKNKKGQLVDFVEFSKYTDDIQKAWGNGFCTFNGANGRAINYVTKYIHKRMVSGDYISMKSNGIGLSFLDEAKKKFFKDNDQQYFRLGNKLVYLPRYLKKKIWTDDQEYKEMNERLAEKISKRESVLCKNSVPQGDLYVTLRESEEIYHSIKAFVDGGQVNKMRIPGFNMDLRDLVDRIDELGFSYDLDTDEFEVLFYYQEKVPVKWFRLKQRQIEVAKYKDVFNQRL